MGTKPSSFRIKMHVEPIFLARITECLITIHHVSNTDPQNVFNSGGVLGLYPSGVNLALAQLWWCLAKLIPMQRWDEMTSARRQHRHKATTSFTLFVIDWSDCSVIQRFSWFDFTLLKLVIWDGITVRFFIELGLGVFFCALSRVPIFCYLLIECTTTRWMNQAMTMGSKDTQWRYHELVQFS